MMFYQLSLACFGLALAQAQTGPSIRQLFSDVPKETPTGTSLKVTGMIPFWLKIDRFYNGFGRYSGFDKSQDAEWEFDYLFDVMSYITKFSIAEGSVQS